MIFVGGGHALVRQAVSPSKFNAISSIEGFALLVAQIE